MTLVKAEMVTSNTRAHPDRVPIGRYGRPDEVAQLAVAVVSNGCITGQTFQVNSGVYAASNGLGLAWQWTPTPSVGRSG